MNCKCKAIPSGHFLVSVVQSLPSQYCLNVLAGCLTDSGERYHQPNISVLCTLWAWGNRQRELQERKSKRVLTWDIPSQNTFFPSSPRSFCCLLPLISHLFPNKPAGMSSFSGLIHQAMPPLRSTRQLSTVQHFRSTRLCPRATLCWVAKSGYSCLSFSWMYYIRNPVPTV